MKLGSKGHMQIIDLAKKIEGHMKRPQPRCDQMTLDFAMKLVEVIKDEKE
jgi:hypothetical protein